MYVIQLLVAIKSYIYIKKKGRGGREERGGRKGAREVGRERGRWRGGREGARERGREGGREGEGGSHHLSDNDLCIVVLPQTNGPLCIAQTDRTCVSRHKLTPIE